MADIYKFGQFRANQQKTYLNALQYNFLDKKVESSVQRGTTFTDKAIELNGSSILQGKTVQGKIKSYYLRFKVYKGSDKQTYNIILRNTSALKDNTQTLGIIQVEAGAANDYSTFEYVITPNENRSFNEIHFELQRILDDFEINNPDGTSGRIPKIEIEKMSEFKNIIDVINPFIENKGALKQIGVQSMPGLLLNINGEQIRVGRSGLYEIKKSDMTIDFIGFVVEDNDKYFILDYQY